MNVALGGERENFDVSSIVVLVPRVHDLSTLKAEMLIGLCKHK